MSWVWEQHLRSPRVSVRITILGGPSKKQGLFQSGGISSPGQCQEGGGMPAVPGSALRGASARGDTAGGSPWVSALPLPPARPEQPPEGHLRGKGCRGCSPPRLPGALAAGRGGGARCPQTPELPPAPRAAPPPAPAFVSLPASGPLPSAMVPVPVPVPTKRPPPPGPAARSLYRAGAASPPPRQGPAGGERKEKQSFQETGQFWSHLV